MTYIGQTQLMTRAGPLPLNFELEANSLAEAAEKFAEDLRQFTNPIAGTGILPYGFNPETLINFRNLLAGLPSTD